MVREITREKWRELCRHGYAFRKAGAWFVLAMDASGATCLEEVTVASKRPFSAETVAGALALARAGTGTKLVAAP